MILAGQWKDESGHICLMTGIESYQWKEDPYGTSVWERSPDRRRDKQEKEGYGGEILEFANHIFGRVENRNKYF